MSYATIHYFPKLKLIVLRLPFGQATQSNLTKERDGKENYFSFDFNFNLSYIYRSTIIKLLVYNAERKQRV